MKRMCIWFLCVLAAVSASAATKAEENQQVLDLAAVAEGMTLFTRVWGVIENVQARVQKNAVVLRRKGIAEVEPSRPATGLTFEVPGIGKFCFDDWLELLVDRRFVTDEEMAVIRQIEAFARKWFPQQAVAAKKRPPRRKAGGAGLPVFRGFEDARYQQHDVLISRMVADFNANKAKWCGGTPEQAAKIGNVTAAMVKSHMIEEAGGNGPASRAAWAVDPLQVNVPGDWGAEKELVGLAKPAKRNEGSVENNVRAAIKYLSRKGFSASARPAAERPNGYFDGWQKALQRYNGRRDRTETDRYYSDEYADKIVKRAANPDQFVPIEIKLAK